MSNERIERKYYLENTNYHQVRNQILSVKTPLQSPYPQRRINNIYFDDLGFRFFYHNIDGQPNRKKIRIRWYGDTFGKALNPCIEYKIKNGLVNTKKLYPMREFKVVEGFNYQELFNAIKISDIPAFVKDDLLSRVPVLINSYLREYFTSTEDDFRITIDENLTYYQLQSLDNQFINKTVKDNDTVVEVKYLPENETEVSDFLQTLPYRITKSSKYVKGVQCIYGVNS